jgi:thiamine-phosphate pyrophosphorylase
MNKGIGRFHVLTDYHFQQRFSHAEIALLAIEGGADTIQFRQKIGGVRHVLAAAIETVDACRSHDVRVLVNDRIDVALASGAAGVHLGQRDFPIPLARSILGPDAVIGGTATSLEQACRVQQEGADYVGFGPVFTTASKRNPASVKGVSALAAVCSSVDIPVIAIAGITADRVGAVMKAGAYGVAVMTQVSMAPAPAVAAREVRTALDAALDSAPGRGSNGRPETRR